MKLPGIPKPTRSYDEECAATREILSLVGDKWSVLVIVNLGAGALRFNSLKRSLDGISQRVLTLTLRNLEREGLVSRTVFPSTPPSVEYKLTALGHTLLEPVTALALWAQTHRAEIEQARAAFERSQHRAS